VNLLCEDGQELQDANDKQKSEDSEGAEKNQEIPEPSVRSDSEDCRIDEESAAPKQPSANDEPGNQAGLAEPAASAATSKMFVC
jgi:hypothetical protein